MAVVFLNLTRYICFANITPFPKKEGQNQEVLLKFSMEDHSHAPSAPEGVVSPKVKAG